MAGFADHFSTIAAGYASYRPQYPAGLFAALASRAPHHRLAWDCAAGNGQATLGLAPFFDRVVATDASAAQLARARAHPRVEYYVAPAEATGLPDHTVALTTVAQSLHWLDLDRFYPEARRVLSPGGLLAVWTYGLLHLDDPALDADVSTFYWKTVGPYWPPGREHVDSGYRTLPFPFDELSVPAPPMEVSWTLPQLLGYVRTWSAVARYIAERGDDPVTAFGRRLAAGWGDTNTARRVSWPLALRVGRV